MSRGSIVAMRSDDAGADRLRGKPYLELYNCTDPRLSHVLKEVSMRLSRRVLTLWLALVVGTLALAAPASATPGTATIGTRATAATSAEEYSTANKGEVRADRPVKVHVEMTGEMAVHVTVLDDATEFGPTRQ
jgi:hypothetical protein